ncbi:MAG TPA: DedA family protein [Actinomycetes bacterium]|nr:DedA family protein [Actinomycetes bacterium]
MGSALNVLPGLPTDLGALGAATAYAVVLGFVFVESGLLVGFLLPGDSILFAAGVLSGRPGSGVDVRLLAAGVLVAAVAGDWVGYLFGARVGRRWLVRRAERGRFDPHLLRRAETFYARWGWWAVVVARWIPWVRTFVPVLAGTSAMPFLRFATANVAGALCWAVGLTVLGHAAATTPGLEHASYAVAAAFVGGSLVAGVVDRVRRRRTARQ